MHGHDGCWEPPPRRGRAGRRRRAPGARVCKAVYCVLCVYGYYTARVKKGRRIVSRIRRGFIRISAPRHAAAGTGAGGRGCGSGSEVVLRITLYDRRNRPYKIYIYTHERPHTQPLRLGGQWPHSKHQDSKKETAVQQSARATLARVSRCGRKGRSGRAAVRVRVVKGGRGTPPTPRRAGVGVYRDTPPPRRGEASFRGGRGREALSTLYRLKLCRSVGLRGERCPGEPRRRSLVMRSCAE